MKIPKADPKMDGKLVHEAMMLAQIAHVDQKYGDLPHIAHVAVVASNFSTPELSITAWLHDVVEDTDITLEYIRATFGQSIYRAVDAITHRKGEDYHTEYLPRCATHPGARLVKVCDVLANLHAAQYWQPQYRRLIPKYERALAFLNDYPRRMTP